MAYTFLKARGLPVGKSLVEDDKLDAARQITAHAQRARRAAARCRSITSSPTKLEPGAAHETLAVDDPAIGDRMGLDIGPKTVGGLPRRWSRARRPSSGTARWACSRCRRSTRARTRSRRRWPTVQGTTIIGGGDSVSAVTKAGVADRDHAHLDRRRRVARVPRRPRAAGGGGAGGQVDTQACRVQTADCRVQSHAVPRA